MSELLQLIRKLPSVERNVNGGAYLFHRDDQVRFVYAIIDGRVELLRRQENGSALTLQRAGPGSILAEASVYSDRYHCDAVAALPSRLLAIGKQELLDRMRGDLAFAEQWSVHLAREVQASRFRSELLAYTRVSDRLDLWLDWHGNALPSRGEWTALAEALGVSREALYRELARRRAA